MIGENPPATETRVNSDGSTVTGIAPIPAEPSLRADPATENRVNSDGSTVTGIAPIPAETTSTAEATVQSAPSYPYPGTTDAAVVRAIADVQTGLDLGIIDGTYQHQDSLIPTTPYPGPFKYSATHPLADELDELHELISHLPGAAALALHNIVKKIEAKL